MIKNEEMAVEIITNLLWNYLLAFHHGGDPVSIKKALTVYCEALKEECNLSDDEMQLLYLKGKIGADKMESEKHFRLKAEVERKMALGI